MHVHLEGCLSPDLVASAAVAAGAPVPSWDGSGGLPAMLAHLDATCGLLRTGDQLASAAYGVARRQADAGSLGADLTVNPAHWPAWQDDLAGLVDGLAGGLRAAEQDGLPPVGLCVSLLRGQSGASACDLVDRLVQMRHPAVVALSVDGDERAAGRTGPRFAEAFHRARAAGLRRTAHAGESSGPQGVRDALDLLGIERVDHGVRAVEDPDLVARLAGDGVPLGVCPTSNVVLGLVDDLARHPLEALRRAGVRVSVNTDDPVLLGTDLLGEYDAVATTFGWTADDLDDVARVSREACFTLARR